MSNQVGAYEHLPEELIWTPQWCVSGPDDKGGFKAPYYKSGNALYRASPTNNAQRMDFETAVENAQAHNTSIGFVLQENDPYTCIDLDVKDKDNEPDPTKWTTQEQFNRFWQIVQVFDSYTERSRSGKGLHIWVRGKIEQGRKRDGVEVYSKERYMICTGDVLINKPIRECQELLDVLVNEMGNGESNNVNELVELDEIDTDETVWQRASGAANNEKFVPLCQGRWQELGYRSQSEADLSLMSMFCFYSKSNSQCRRLFRMTELGKREKAVKDDRYLNYTLSRIRARQAREELASLDAAEQAKRLVMQMQQQSAPSQDVLAPSAVTMATMAPLPKVAEDGLDWPPGFAGHIAGYIYRSAPRPVKEVAIVAALGLLAGICGKPFSIPGSGLNLYIILVARSAIGKEAMHSGIASLMEAMRSRLPQAMNFVDFSDFASGPALTKAVAANPCFVNVAGEWGRKLKRIAKEDRADGPMQALRTTMTNLYQKSGPASIVGGITYSNKDQNIQAVSGVAYSMIGETTPSTLYESLTESMMEDGFLSRFVIMEYTGERPPHNYAALHQPDQALADALAQLCHHSLMLLSRGARQDVLRDDRAAQMLYEFDIECDRQINATADESQRQMWNRAALKVTRIAALLAVADNFLNPVIQEHHVTWSLDVIKRDIRLMKQKLTDGDIGVSDDSRERKILAICEEYVRMGASNTYGISPKMLDDRIIPRKYIQARANRHTAFNAHKLGSNVAIDMTMRSLIDCGYVVEVQRDQLVREYGYHGKCYRLISLNSGRS